PGIREVGRELGVRYVLEGSVRKAGTHVRIAAQLVDAQSAVQLWADRFDGELADIFALQDEITSRVVIALLPAVQQVEIRRSFTKPTGSLPAYDCILRATSLVDALSPASNGKALELCLKAIELDPNFALAWACAA